MSEGLRPTVLIVDDNDVTRSLLRSIVRLEGYEVIGEARDGEQGLEMALRLMPNAICLDVVMPKRNGLEVLGDIRAKLPNMPVVMITGSADRETVQAAIKAGANGFIVKPFNQARVHDALAAALGDAAPAPQAS